MLCIQERNIYMYIYLCVEKIEDKYLTNESNHGLQTIHHVRNSVVLIRSISGIYCGVLSTDTYVSFPLVRHARIHVGIKRSA